MSLIKDCNIKVELNPQQLHPEIQSITTNSLNSLNVRLKDSRILLIPVGSSSGIANALSHPSTSDISTSSVFHQHAKSSELSDDHPVSSKLPSNISVLHSKNNQMKVYIKATKIDKGKPASSTSVPVSSSATSNNRECSSSLPTSRVNGTTDVSTSSDQSSSAQGWLCARPLKSKKRPLPDTWTTGTWSEHEIQQLRNNITHYCNMHGLSDPSEVIFSMTKTQRSGFYKEISKNINRPLFSVYRKVIRMYDCRNYLGRYSKEELEQLKILHSQLGNNWQAIAARLGRSSASVKDRCRLLRNRANNRGAWTEEEEDRLAAAVEQQVGSIGSAAADYSTGITWSAVSAVVGTRTEKQCRTKWLHYLNWKRNSGVSWSKHDDLQLICRLSVCGVSEEKEVDWAALARGWPAARSPHWLRCKWWTLKHKLDSRHSSSLKEKCRALYNSTPGNVLRSTLIAVPTATASSAQPDMPRADDSSSSLSCLNVKICIAAANFAEIINFDGPDEEKTQKLQKLLQSAVVVTETPDGNDVSQLSDLSGDADVSGEADTSSDVGFDAAADDSISNFVVVGDSEETVENHPLRLVQLDSVTSQSFTRNIESPKLVQDDSISGTRAASSLCLLPFNAMSVQSVSDSKESLTTSVSNAQTSLSVATSSLDGQVSRCVRDFLHSDTPFGVDDNTYSINAEDLCGLTGSDVLVVGSEVCAVTDNSSRDDEGELSLMSSRDTSLSVAANDSYSDHCSLRMSRDDVLDCLHVPGSERDVLVGTTDNVPVSLTEEVDEISDDGKRCLPVVREDRPLSSAANSIYDQNGRLIEDEEELDVSYAH